MTFDSSIDDDGRGVVTIQLSGELDRQAAPRFNDIVLEAADLQPSRLVLMMGDLEYLSSAGLRSLVLAHQKMPADVHIVLVDTRPEIAETIRMTGFDRSVEMQQSSGR